jgi:hypothetical protein
MLTIAIVVFGITIENFHIDLLAEAAKDLPAFVILLLNDLMKQLPKSLEFQPSFGIARLDIKFGPEVEAAPLSKKVLSVPSGTVKTVAANTHVVIAATPPVFVPAPQPVPDTVSADADLDPSVVQDASLDNTPLGGLQGN